MNSLLFEKYLLKIKRRFSKIYTSLPANPIVETKSNFAKSFAASINDGYTKTLNNAVFLREKIQLQIFSCPCLLDRSFTNSGYVGNKNMKYKNACAEDHRDYKRIEAASGDESRNKLNKSNGGQI